MPFGDWIDLATRVTGESIDFDRNSPGRVAQGKLLGVAFLKGSKESIRIG